MSQQSSPQPVHIDPAAAAQRRKENRTKWFIRLGLALAVIAAVAFFYWLFVASRKVSTDDAYVGASTAQITAQITGPIVTAPVGDTDRVKKDQVVATIDPTDFQIAVDKAKAELNQTERKVQQYFANDKAMAAQTSARETDIERANAQIASAKASLARAEAEASRRQKLAGSGAVSADEITEADTRVDTTRADLRAAEAQLAQAKANVVVSGQQRQAAAVLIAGGGVDANPEVAAAKAKLAQAQLDLSRTVIRSPDDGVIAKNVIEVGQRVQAGAPLMVVVPIQAAYVDANFKEVQLRKIHIGSDVVLTSDLYGGKVKYHGKVIGIAGGSGAAFSLIPAQNATGNWIKVVQRVPVRIALDPKELKDHPLRVGLSMKADVAVK
ncbi:MAG TPA: HlyD family secretion protein [Caulobacteraceae bacterium]|nr:HlyD family secretion protein [Caulobacteraceae bacterium]